MVTLAEELRNPWGLAFLLDGGWLVTERSGFLRRVAPDGSKSRVDGLPEVVPRGQGGLLNVVLDPGFAENLLVYIAYVAGDGAVSTEVGRGRLSGTRLEDFEVILVSEPKLRGGQHFGARLRFAPDGALLVTLGDRYSQLEQAQELGDRIVAQEALLTGLDERIRDVRAGPDGFIYVLTDSYDGRLLRLEPVD